jgi:hypothetical protein
MGRKADEKTTTGLTAVIQTEITATQEAIQAFTDWFKGLREFFTKAYELERKATETLAQARALKAPKNADEDARIQAFIIDANAAAKHAEGHWIITKAAKALHTRLVERRSRAVDPNKDAAKIAQDIHNTYVAEERRKAIVKQDKLQAKENDKAAKTGTEARQIIVEPKIEQAGTDRTTWTGEVTDLQALVDAVIAGTVPRDVLMVNQPVLNGYARSMHALLNNWPGVRAVPKTTTVG